MRNIMITGMFRSGSTLLSKLMNFHSEVVVANDSFLHFFRRFRDRAYSSHATHDWTPGGPFKDNFLNPNVAARLAIAGSDLSERLSPEDLDALNNRVDDTTAKFHPGLLEDIARIWADTFAGFFEELMVLVARSYPKQGCADPVVGFKMSWLEEFIPAMLRAFPDFKVLLLYRDVRAVAASQNAKEEKRPYLFYARNWRKSVASLIAFTNPASGLADRVLPVCYESLVDEPEKQARRICDFLGLEYDPAMIDVSSNVDQTTGTNWESNSSYGQQQGIFTSSVDRWKQTLTPDQIDFLEYLCGPELHYLGYELVGRHRTASDFPLPDMEPNEAELVSWLRGEPESAHLTDASKWKQVLENEEMRRAVLAGSESLDGDGVVQFFLYPEALAVLSEAYADLS
ncbi:hypothetical protein GM415_12335 [Pseudodesulfovibrio cashew]|uniref:Sulfotransferase n=1 Tax=Pseudodesulfovibrio cashew TaxID=2678688 RepID=A0A6I6JKP6_9BACT|nr:sulfotransferase [Pseudodesulfovibrio cashew]QGY40883.1 hypothetical protein GM415_12335 [Pseudodesulfovibrio cashew]